MQSNVILLMQLKEFSDDYVSYAIKGNLMYENAYPLVSALSRPLIAKTG